MPLIFTNDALSTIDGAISDTATTIVLTTDANLFPAPTGDEYAHLTLFDFDGNKEIVKLTARSGTSCTVVRGQEGTTAAAWPDGSRIELRVTAAGLNEKATAASVVRHDEAQTLTIAQQYQARTNIGAGFGFENRLINPLFQVDIEGNAVGIVVDGRHVVEGWVASQSSDVTTLQASRVAGETVPYALKMLVQTGSDASIGATQYALLQTAIEGYDIADAQWGTADAKPVWVCGRIKAPTTGTYCVVVRNGAGDRTYVFEVACTAGTWVDFEKEVPGDTSGTWVKTNAPGFLLAFTVASGSTYNTTADTWTAGSFTGTANQANGLATNGNVYEIEDIRVSVGKPVKTEWRPYALDLMNCHRYFWKSDRAIEIRKYFSGSDVAYEPIDLPPMRATPSNTISGVGYNGVGNSHAIGSSAGGLCYIQVGASGAGMGGVAFNLTRNARMI